ncbi:class I SAM-dependent methyltransferase [Stella sp.]|uniref:class I SAM-dependent methyltransferase n=1 Tax=Stella sp. TaxID=2912054 RepID=UPI0035AF30BA
MKIKVWAEEIARRHLDPDAIRRTYDRYARVYDGIFGPILNPGRRRAVVAAERAAGLRILEVGVGTGLSLPLYRRSRVVGIDVSDKMLERARRRVERHGLTNVEDLQVMDAEATAFPAQSFDSVVLMHVASVVPHPDRLMLEMRRVLRPGGEAVVLNHFWTGRGPMAVIERALAPASNTIGFRPLSLDELISVTPLTFVSEERVNLFGYWSLVRFRRD